ncbi:hypothetical protein ACOQFV_30605 [Nocardiopsis changdeensis]|uniref:Uncharacterized protein n=1 Tax=Nocardiopsis changdeensis TaxID=2831969 RepID=A0ABX8BQY4_9ACTN|nr:MULTISPECIES: hypothetical protein [Nocardiopsis]QUX24168.1 hypothetical protein KGD84_07660 [Nocardiopsis changdeensis]QYX34563.1 hypothetical protein K1J57_17120 [Nocardiopsis sp. MT53]
MTHAHEPTRSGRPPLAVWACGTHDHDPDEYLVPARLAERLVAEYTRPGQAVADLTGTGMVTNAALQSERTTSPATTGDGTEEVGWADLAVLHVPVPSDRMRPEGASVRARLVFAATVTRPGGIVAVITGLDHTRAGALVDPAPTVVRSAACADLVYLQHVIALTVPICLGGLGATVPVRDRDDSGLGWWEDDPEVEEAGLAPSVAEAAVTITSPAHLNVSVFRLRRLAHRTDAGRTGEVAA